MDKNRGKQKVEEVEEVAEDWCFVCYIGGTLLVCDHKGCGKVYHPKCVAKKNTILKSKAPWICARHSCRGCNASPQFYCLTCPKAFCNGCVTNDFVPAKSDKGLCQACFELTLRCTELAKINSEKDIINIEDEDPEMFKAYLEMIMKDEGLTYDDLCHTWLKNLDSVGVEAKDCIVKISDGERVKDPAPIDMSSGKRNKSGTRKHDRRPSKDLIDILSSIGVVGPEKLTRCHVDIEISKYILRENLFADEEQDAIRCNEELYSLFQKKRVRKNEIYDLLLQHFNAKSRQTNTDGTQTSSGNEDEEIDAESKRKRKMSPDIASLDHKMDCVVQETYSLVAREPERPGTLSLVEVPIAVQASDYASATAESESVESEDGC